jgi:hypothetical protein
MPTRQLPRYTSRPSRRSQGRGAADPDSDIDLLVVLDEVEGRGAEMTRVDPILWRHSLANDAVITETLLDRARQEVAAARVLARAACAAQSVSRAYYGAFYAAIAASIDQTSNATPRSRTNEQAMKNRPIGSRNGCIPFV